MAQIKTRICLFIDELNLDAMRKTFHVLGCDGAFPDDHQPRIHADKKYQERLSMLATTSSNNITFEICKVPQIHSKTRTAGCGGIVQSHV